MIISPYYVEHDDRSWPVYGVLVVKWRGNIAYRVGVGIVWAEAFHYAKPKRKKFYLDKDDGGLRQCKKRSTTDFAVRLGTFLKLTQGIYIPRIWQVDLRIREPPLSKPPLHITVSTIHSNQAY